MTDSKSAPVPAGSHAQARNEAEVDHTAEELIGLREAAEQLDVHYMTAYRYVRTGRIAAEKNGGRWWIRKSDLAQVAGSDAPSAVTPRPRTELVEPLVARLVNSDFAGSWQLIEGALASGATPTEVHRELLGPAMMLIGQRWHEGDLTIGDEHRATATCHRLLGRMSSTFRPVGRRRGSVVIGAISGDYHGLPSAMLADILESKHLSVIDLGSNTPASSFAEVASEVDDLIGIGVVATLESVVDDAASACNDLARAFPDAVVVLGGAGVRSLSVHDLATQSFVTSHSAEDACSAFTSVATSGSSSAEVPAVG